jgi:hypothetical protein
LHAISGLKPVAVPKKVNLKPLLFKLSQAFKCPVSTSPKAMPGGATMTNWQKARAFVADNPGAIGNKLATVAGMGTKAGIGNVPADYYTEW